MGRSNGESEGILRFRVDGSPRRPAWGRCSRWLAEWSWGLWKEPCGPGTWERLGFEYPVLKAANPRIILASISGFGQTGPYAKRAGLEGYGLSIRERVPIEITANAENIAYLRAKREKLGHLLENLGPAAGEKP